LQRAPQHAGQPAADGKHARIGFVVVTKTHLSTPVMMMAVMRISVTSVSAGENQRQVENLAIVFYAQLS
jgi:hypothetical protein